MEIFPVPGPLPSNDATSGARYPAAGALGVITAVLISVVIFPLISFFRIVVVSDGGIPSTFPVNVCSYKSFIICSNSIVIGLPVLNSCINKRMF